MNRKTLRSAAPAAAALTLVLGLSACGAANEEPSDSGSSDSAATVSGTLNGGGSSAQESAVGAWQSAFQTANPDATVNYDPIGSGGGREQFLAGGISFAGSDAALTDEELVKAKDRCGSDVVEVPVYVSPIAIMYNLDGVDDLNLTPEVVGGIFAGKITSWDDPTIVADNPDAKLPKIDITPVHRSDDSGTTENFTEYLDATSGGAWSDGPLQTWPVKGGEGAEGTSGVVSAVTNGKGTIGYADASQVGDLHTAKIKVGDEFVAFTPEAAAATLDASTIVEGRAATDIALKIDRTVDEAGVYPIILASYQIACQTYEDADEAALVKAWLTYVASDEGQAASAKDAGSAPLSKEFAPKVQAAVETIAAA